MLNIYNSNLINHHLKLIQDILLLLIYGYNAIIYNRRQRGHKMKKIILISLLMFALTGCSNDLAKLNAPEDLVIDTREDFDPKTILTEIEEGVEVSYKLDEENSKIVITLTKDDKTQNLEAPVTIQKPLVVPNENITIDTYKGYDINTLINVEEGTEVTETLDEEKGILTITAKNGDREEIFEVPVEVTNSSPYPITCQSTVDEVGTPLDTSITFLSDSEFRFDSPYSGTEFGTYDNSNIALFLLLKLMNMNSMTLWEI